MTLGVGDENDTVSAKTDLDIDPIDGSVSGCIPSGGVDEGISCRISFNRTLARLPRDKNGCQVKCTEVNLNVHS